MAHADHAVGDETAQLQVEVHRPCAVPDSVELGAQFVEHLCVEPEVRTGKVGGQRDDLGLRGSGESGPEAASLKGGGYAGVRHGGGGGADKAIDFVDLGKQGELSNDVSAQRTGGAGDELRRGWLVRSKCDGGTITMRTYHVVALNLPGMRHVLWEVGGVLLDEGLHLIDLRHLTGILADAQCV